MAAPVAIIGAGNIASCLRARLEEAGYEIAYQIRRETYRTADGQEHSRENFPLRHALLHSGVKVVFLAIPTLDHGETAKEYILTSLAAHARVITCEKGSLAYYANALTPELDRIGFTACVGGGTQMLPFVRRRRRDGHPLEIHAVLNGTLNFVLDEAAHGGRSLGEACVQAERLGYAEPGSAGALSLLNGELRDIVMKTCVFFNTALATDQFITPDDIGECKLSELSLLNLSDESADRRFVVTFSNRWHRTSTPEFDGSFSLNSGEWHIEGGFRSISKEKELAGWLPGGVGNALHIVEGDLGIGGKYLLSGPGAGAEATVAAMMSDL